MRSERKRLDRGGGGLRSKRGGFGGDEGKENGEKECMERSRKVQQ